MVEMIVIVAILVGGYFGYRWYKKNEAEFNKDMDDMSE